MATSTGLLSDRRSSVSSNDLVTGRHTLSVSYFLWATSDALGVWLALASAHPSITIANWGVVIRHTGYPIGVFHHVLYTARNPATGLQ
jgi:hypothetical protein